MEEKLHDAIHWIGLSSVALAICLLCAAAVVLSARAAWWAFTAPWPF